MWVHLKIVNYPLSLYLYLSSSLYQNRVLYSFVFSLAAIYNREFCTTQKMKMLARDKICGEKHNSSPLNRQLDQ